jgi:hypothetical protein
MSKLSHLPTLKYHFCAFCCICKQGRKQKPRLHRRIVRRNQKPPRPSWSALPMSKLMFTCMRCIRIIQGGGVVCWRLFSLSHLPPPPPPSFSFLSLLSPSHPSSLRCVFKNRFGGARNRKAATRMVWEASRVNLRVVGACEASLAIALRTLETGLLVRPKPGEICPK